MRLDGRVILITVVEYQEGTLQPYVVRRWRWPIPEDPEGWGALDTLLVGTGGIVL
jgi:hypothetical protein